MGYFISKVTPGGLLHFSML